MSCNQNYHATGCLVKVLPLMNEGIESTESWASLMCISHFLKTRLKNYLLLTNKVIVLINEGSIYLALI